MTTPSSEPATAPWEKLGVPTVINAAGKMTYLGSAAVSDQVAYAMAAGARSYVDMATLKNDAGKRIAHLLGAPAARVTASAAAAITQSVAATITGDDLASAEQVPAVDTQRNRIVMQKSHAVHFGAPLTQMVRLGGGVPVEVGSANRAHKHHLAAAIDEHTAAILHAVSHHVHAESAADLAEVVAVARTYDIPVIVDAAAEMDLTGPLHAGVDLVCYSGHKAIGGPTSGLVVGSADLIERVALQENGVGRAMKVGKEAIAGLLVAVEEYVAGAAAGPKELESRLDDVRHTAGPDIPADLTIVWDPQRPIPRLRVVPGNASPITAAVLVAELEGLNPSIRTRNHDIAQGAFTIDPRELTPAGAQAVGSALRTILHRVPKEAP